MKQVRSSKPKKQYRIYLNENRLLRGCALTRKFPFEIYELGNMHPVQFASGYEAAAQWVKNNNGILVREKRK